jgi:Tol biopolymer transport system component
MNEKSFWVAQATRLFSPATRRTEWEQRFEPMGTAVSQIWSPQFRSAGRRPERASRPRYPSSKHAISTRALLASVLLLFLGLPTAPLQAASLGQFEDHTDLGSPKLSGSAAYDAVSQEYSVSAAGVNMWANRDEFHFLWKRMRGDFILQARVEFIGKGVDPHRKLGWIVRSTLDEDSPYADATVHGDGLTSLQFRRTKGAITEQVRSTATGPDFIQFERKRNDYIFSAARFGEPLVSCQTNLVLGDEVYAGLFLCSHNSNAVEKAIFRDVRIIRPAKANFVPYRDYIGSHLEILEVATGRRQLIHSSAQPFEAPNWTPDGAALIYNTSGRDANYRGRLYRFDLATRKAGLILTDFAIRNNNDHVLSFDGKTIGISHHSTNHGGGSVIYTLPITGGTPKLITPLAPSYLHGWSPDGKFLVFTGGRNDEFDIYKIPAEGGQEIRLTTVKGLDDGPEYTPDGKQIYFNSTRGGTMQIWRMKPDGSEQEPVTRDEHNNWFPHISPDGKWIAFLTFGKEIDPTDHPYYKQVYLRLMPIEGGAARVIGYVYGGQGTMNVPSWSPDSRKLAFVSNSNLDMSN